MSGNEEIIQPKKKIRKRFLFNRFAMFFNHIAAVCLLIAYMAPHVSPENFWFIAFFGLAYPLFVILNILFVIYWAAQFKKRALYSLIIIFSGWMQLHAYFQVNFNHGGADKHKIKVMSYNVKVFDLYNWSKNIETRDNMFNLINDEHTDIMCLQEFFSRDSSKLNNLDSMLTFRNTRYAHVEYTTTVKRIHHWGIATFSNYPIIKKGKITFDTKSNNLCIYTDVVIAKDTVRIYNMHLQSIHFDYEDYQFVEDVMNNKETEEIEKSKNILKRIKRAFVKRARQSDIVASHIASSPYPVIICGDFNDTPASYTYTTIRQKLKDSFIESGNGFGRTYVGKFPSFRIDYILHSREFNSYDFQTVRQELSDHYPVTCTIEL